MTSARAVLLLIAAGLLATAGAAPAATGDLSGKANAADYKCCRKSLFSKPGAFVDAPSKISTLQLCKDYCEEHKYGPAVFRSTGWGCSSQGFRCNLEVDKDLCADITSGVKGYFRFYPTSSVTQTTETITRNTRGSSGSSIDTRQTDDTKRDQDIFGGRASTQTASTRLDQQDLTVDNNQQRELKRSEATTFRFQGGARLGANVDVGSTGSATETVETVRDRTARTDTRRIKQVEDTKDTSVQDIQGDRRRVFQRRNQDASVTRDAARKDDEIVNGTSKATTISVSGTARLTGGSSLLKGAHKSDLRLTDADLSGNVTASLVNTRRTRTLGGFGDLDERRRITDTSLGLEESGNAAALRRTRQDRVGRRKQTFETAGKDETESDQTVISKAGVGTIDQTRSKLEGQRDNRTSTLDVEDSVTTVNSTAECPNCLAQGREVIRSREAKDSLVDARSKFNDTKVSTLTGAEGGPLIHLEGQTRNELNGTSEDVQSSDRTTHDRNKRAEHNCDHKTGKCQGSEQSSGSTTTVSRNSSKVDDVVETKKQVVKIANYG